jgi:hypothetical protein
MFLGAHDRFYMKIYIKSVHCCSSDWDWQTRLTGDDMSDFTTDLTSDEIISAAQTIIRHASEFAACMHLSANLFIYFVHYTQGVDMDNLCSTLFRESLQSSMAYTILYEMAHGFRYYKSEAWAEMPFVKTPRYISEVWSRYLDIGEHEGNSKRCDEAKEHLGRLLDSFTRTNSTSNPI